MNQEVVIYQLAELLLEVLYECLMSYLGMQVLQAIHAPSHCKIKKNQVDKRTDMYN